MPEGLAQILKGEQPFERLERRRAVAGRKMGDLNQVRDGRIIVETPRDIAGPHGARVKHAEIDAGVARLREDLLERGRLTQPPGKLGARTARAGHNQTNLLADRKDVPNPQIRLVEHIEREVLAKKAAGPRDRVEVQIVAPVVTTGARTSIKSYRDARPAGRPGLRPP